MPHKERKVAAVGMTRMLFQSRYSVQEPSVSTWYVLSSEEPQAFHHVASRPAALESLIKLFSEPQYFKTSTNDDSDPLSAITEIDFEEQTAGYQAAYSRLAASESAEVDPVAYVADPQVFLGQQVVEFSRQQGGILKQLLARGDPGVIQPFVGSLAAAGYTI